YQGVHLLSLAVAIRVPVDAVDVVTSVEGMASPRIADRSPFELQTPAVEQHYRNVDSACTCSLYAFSQTAEVSRIELRQIEPRPTVQRLARPRPQVRQRRNDHLLLCARKPRSLLPNIKSDEVVAVALEEVEVAEVVEHGWRVRQTPILKIVPSM